MYEKSFYDMIYKRKSFHLFRNIGDQKLSLEEITEIKEKYATFTPLYPDIQTKIKIVPTEETNCKRGEAYCIL